MIFLLCYYLINKKNSTNTFNLYQHLRYRFWIRWYCYWYLYWGNWIRSHMHQIYSSWMDSTQKSKVSHQKRKIQYFFLLLHFWKGQNGYKIVIMLLRRFYFLISTLLLWNLSFSKLNPFSYRKLSPYNRLATTPLFYVCNSGVLNRTQFTSLIWYH